MPKILMLLDWSDNLQKHVVLWQYSRDEPNGNIAGSD